MDELRSHQVALLLYHGLEHPEKIERSAPTTEEAFDFFCLLARKSGSFVKFFLDYQHLLEQVASKTNINEDELREFLSKILGACKDLPIALQDEDKVH
ncbi:MAG: hypothetical protein KW806_03345 [Candidatus Yanofskybacteria bacterium]|nr:hypothetical protein [Candidatus Yanofskybacteria bacterium]